MSILAVPRRLLTHRLAVLGLTAALTAVLLVAVTIPDEPPALQADALRHYFSAGGLHHAAVAWPLALLLAAFAASLALSCLDQLGAAWRRTFAPAVGAGAALPSGVGEVELAAILRASGFRRTAATPSRDVWTRHALGHWGGVLLHAGIAVSLAAFVRHAALERKGVATVTAGEVLEPGTPWIVEHHGLLAGPLELRGAVSLEGLSAAFRPDDSLAAVSAELAFARDGHPPERVVVPASGGRAGGGVRVHQGRARGHAFALELTDAAGRSAPLELRLPLPPDRRSAGYGDHQPDGASWRLRAKYFLPGADGSPGGGAPRLVLRLVEGRRVLSELALREGEGGVLGPFQVRLAAVRPWATLLFDGGADVTAVLVGFLLTMIGAVVVYTLVPRAVTVGRTPGGLVLGWRAWSRFADRYEPEREALLARCRAGARP